VKTIVGILALALLTGCASEPFPVTIEPDSVSPFIRPQGTSSNPRLGFIGNEAVKGEIVLIELARENSSADVKSGFLVVTRNSQLQPTAILKVKEVKGMAATAIILRGQPSRDEEVVLPSALLLESAGNQLKPHSNS